MITSIVVSTACLPESLLTDVTMTTNEGGGLWSKESIQFVDQELARLQAQVAAMQTARMAYASALKAALPTVASGDTIKLS